MAQAGTHPHTHVHHDEEHRSHRSGWLRAAVLGAHDGLVSTACLIVGVASSGASDAAVRTAGIAGLAAGALSMAVGEYSSVASQRDVEQADLEVERQALEEHPHAELAELTEIYRRRGLTPDLAAAVARQLTEVDALAAHARDEIGLTDLAPAHPFQAAWTSALAFSLGAIVPLAAFLLAVVAPAVTVYVVALVGLGGLGALGAAVGGAPRLRATARVAVLGLAAMAVTSGVGEVTGAVLG